MGRTCIVQLQESEGLSIQWSMVSRRFSNRFVVHKVFLPQVCLVNSPPHLDGAHIFPVTPQSFVLATTSKNCMETQS